MKLSLALSVFVVVTVLSSAANAELQFRPVEVEGDARTGGVERRLGRCGWGQFEEDTSGEYCMANIGGKAVLEKCINDDPPARQLWRFAEKLEYDEDELPYDCGGILRNKADKMCLAPVGGRVNRGRRVTLDKCDKDNEKQQWLGDGDSLSSESKSRLCVWFRGELEEGAPMGLKKCDNLDSLNFFK